MQIQVNTDKNIEGTEALKQQVVSTLERILDRFSNHITRVELHLSDENSASKDTSKDKRCLLEVRVAGMQPVSVTDLGDSVDQVVTGAARKMVSALDSALGKMNKN